MTKSKDIKLTSLRLNYRLISSQDEADVFETLNDKKTCDIIYFLSWPMNIEQARWWCSRSENAYKNGEFHFIAHHKETGQPIGCIGLHPDTENPASLETGYWVSPKAQGQGFAYEMLNTIIDYAQNELKAHEIFAVTDRSNNPSKNLLEKSGILYAGTRDIIRPDGSIRLSNYYSRKLKIDHS